MTRILLISHISPPSVDGGSKVIHKMGEYFARQGFEVASLSSDASSTDDFTHPYTKIPESKDLKFQSSKVLYFCLPVYTIFHRPIRLASRLLPSLSVFAKGPIFKFVPFLKFLFFYLKFKPDYIIAGPLPTTIVLYAHLLKFLFKVLTFHRTKVLINASFHPTDPDFFNPFLVNALKPSDFIWTLTDFETNYFHQNFHIPYSKMINVGNGIDSSLITKVQKLQSSKVLNLLYIGSFASHKGIATIIDAFTLLTKALKFQRSKVLSLTLAGQPTLYSPIIEQKIRSLPTSIRSRIKLIYKFKTKDLKLLLDQSSILISASSQESFGLVLLEAMARGVPVIGADIPATSEIIKKSGAGITFKTDDPKDLAQKILMLQKSKAQKLYRTKALSFASAHTWDRIGDSLWQKISF